MKNILCKGGEQREGWAISLSVASALIMSLEALHPGSCQWMGLNADQSFALSALFATTSIFLGTFIATHRTDKA